MADRRLAFREWAFEIARTDFFVSRDEAEQSETDWVGERREESGRLSRVDFVHRRRKD